MALVPLLKEAAESLLAPFHFVRTAQVGSKELGEGPSLSHASVLILDLIASRTVRNKLLFISYSVYGILLQQSEQTSGFIGISVYKVVVLVPLKSIKYA